MRTCQSTHGLPHAHHISNTWSYLQPHVHPSIWNAPSSSINSGNPDFYFFVPTKIDYSKWNLEPLEEGATEEEITARLPQGSRSIFNPPIDELPESRVATPVLGSRVPLPPTRTTSPVNPTGSETTRPPSPKSDMADEDDLFYTVGKITMKPPMFSGDAT
jgi:hypothetical protein